MQRIERSQEGVTEVLVKQGQERTNMNSELQTPLLEVVIPAIFSLISQGLNCAWWIIQAEVMQRSQSLQAVGLGVLPAAGPAQGCRR